MEKRKKTLLILGLCIFTLTLIGLSYAFWQIALQQTDENVVYTDCLDLKFVGENNINLQNAYPMTYEEQESFFASETPYHFTITNQCESKANLSINIETLEVTDEENPLDDEWVDVILYEGNEKINVDETTILNNSDKNGHYKLTASDVNDNRLLEESEKAYTLHSFTIEKNETKDFSMYLFLDEDTPVETKSGKKTTNAEWKGKVTINAAYRVPVKNMIRKIASNSANDYEGDIEGIWGYKDQITKIVLKDTLEPPETYEESFDESDNGDESVMSYLVSNEEDGSYIAYIQADGKIIANYDSSELFRSFGYVESIDGLENLDTSQVTNMSYMFAEMESLGELIIPNTFDTSNVTNMYEMFESLSFISTLDLGESFNTSNVKNMSGMFSGLHELKELTLPSSFNTSQVTDMSYMFSGARSLTNLALGENFDTRNVTDMSGMFNGLYSLETLDLKNKFDTSQVTNMSQMFTQMSALTELNLGDSFDTSQVTNMSYMFQYTSSLPNLDLKTKFNTEKVTDMSYMFYSMESLNNLDLGNLFDTSQVINMEYMFSGMRKITELPLGEKFNTSNVTNMSYMFSNINNLENLDLSQYNFDTSQVTNMSFMFYRMTSLVHLTLGDQFNTSNVTNMSYLFDGDSALSTINYGQNFIRNANASTKQMFLNCPAPKPEHESWNGVTDWE